MARNEKSHGYHWALLSSPGRELEDRRGDQDRDRDPLQAVEDQPPGPALRPAEQPRVDGPELHQQQRHRRAAGDDVQPLGDPVAPGRRHRERHRVVGVLRVVADQPGREADAEADAQPQPHPRGHRGAAQPRGEVRLGRRPQRLLRGHVWTVGSVSGRHTGSAPYEVVTGPDAHWSRARLALPRAAPAGAGRGGAGAGRGGRDRGGRRRTPGPAGRAGGPGPSRDRCCWSRGTAARPPRCRCWPTP